MKKINLFGGVSFFTGFCALSYALILAQLWAASGDKTPLRYIVMFGIYLLASRAGFLAAKRHKEARRILCLIKNNLGLTFLGCFSAGLMFLSVSSKMFFAVKDIIAFGSMAGIGFLSGRGDSLVRALSGDRQKLPDTDCSVLFHAGNFCAAVFFCLFIYPHMGLLSGLGLIGIINALTGIGLFNFHTLFHSVSKQVIFVYSFFQACLGMASLLVLLNAKQIYDFIFLMYMRP